ncbi:MAG: GNAT family N-acetyltransferase [Myxococcales bacterium]|nr:GNAT family N-acetyltransferase [Myxococcales bacterium]
MQITLRFVAADAPEIQGEHELRYQVLRKPLGYGRDAVAFDFDDDSYHLLAFSADEVVGCVLFHPESPLTGRLYQMAVDPRLQSAGLGRRLVAELETRLQRDGFREVTLHAREVAAGFYGRLGYATVGAPFEEVGVPHRHMAKTLRSS